MLVLLANARGRGLVRVDFIASSYTVSMVATAFEFIGELVSTHKWFFVFAHVLSVVVAMGAAFTIDFLTAYFAKNRTFSAPEVRTLRF